MKNKFKAFTLAEILISLAIIGVVAAIATPVITSSIGDRAIISSVKKHYKAIQMAIAKSGLYAKNYNYNWSVIDADKEKFLKSFNYAKLCMDGTGCWPEEEYEYRNGGTIRNSINGYSSIILSDGSIVGIYIYGGDGVWFFVDINGKEGPNKFGRDLFLFEQYIDVVTNDVKFGPYIADDDCGYADESGWGNQGYGCSYCAVFDNSLECKIPTREVPLN